MLADAGLNQKRKMTVTRVGSVNSFLISSDRSEKETPEDRNILILKLKVIAYLSLPVLIYSILIC